MFGRLQKKEIKQENFTKEENKAPVVVSTNNKSNNFEKKKVLFQKQEIKKKEIWDDENVILNLSMPQEIKTEGRIKRRFKIQLEYQDKSGKVHKKWIRFGKNGVTEYIDDQNEEKKNKLYSKLGNTHNILHPNFWRLHLLNETNDLKENWMKIINKF